MRLSIIIPVYNVEQYIERCLQSCLQQPYVTADDYELVIVNDGTKDDSMTIVERLTSGRANVTLIDQHNQGLSMARNAGLKAAKGDYVWFVDSDDWIERGCLHEIIERLAQTEVDILQLQYKNVYSDGTPSDEHYATIEGIVSGRDLLVTNSYFTAVPFMIYRREFMLEHQLSFRSGIYHEDNEFKPRAVYLAERCASYDKVAYNYFKGNVNSITAQLKLKNGTDLFIVMNNLYRFVEDHRVTGACRRATYTQIGFAMRIVLRTLNSVDEADGNQLRQMMRDNRHLLRCLCRANNIKVRLGGMLMYLHLPLGLKVYKSFC
jgi:glycosyltransferase involved in cell wall biosynthesis